LRPRDLIELDAGAVAETKLARGLIETFERIAANHAKLDWPLQDLLARQQLTPYRRSRQHHEACRRLRDEIVADLMCLNIKENLLHDLVDRLTPIRGRLRILEQRLAQLADAYGVSRQEFLAEYRGHELEQSWLERLASSGRSCWVSLLAQAAEEVAQLRRGIRSVAEETRISISEFRVAVEAAHKGQRDLVNLRQETGR
jgi:RNA polymerase primary sigma factor